jgi:signal transduction histidine kinase
VNKYIKRYLRAVTGITVIFYTILITLFMIFILPSAFQNANQHIRVTILSGNGDYIFNNWIDDDQRQELSNLPEISNALKNNIGFDTRISKTEKVKMIYIALKIDENHVLRFSSTITELNKFLKEIITSILVGIIIFLVLTKLMSKYLAKQFCTPFYTLELDENDQLNSYAVLKKYPEFRSFFERIVSQLKQRHQFVSNVSHEVQAPLAAISGQADMLRDMLSDTNPEVTKIAERIQVRAEELAKTTSSLLMLSKVSKKNYILHYDKFDIRLLVQSAIELCPENSNKILTTYTSESGNYVVEVDKELLNIVLGCLINNAIKYCSAYIKIGVNITNENITFSVNNDGEIISADDLPCIFDRFYRVNKSQKLDTQGYGVGLALVKEIAKCLDGKVDVVSDAVTGTTFSLCFPRTRKT